MGVSAVGGVGFLLSGAAATGTAARALSTRTPLVEGAVVKADDDNTGSVYVGFSAGVTANAGAATSGFRLKAGQGVTINIDDASKLFLIGGAASQNYTIIGAGNGG